MPDRIKGLSVDEIIQQFRNLQFSESNMAAAAYYKDQLAAIAPFHGDSDIDELIRYVFDSLRDLHEEGLDSSNAEPTTIESPPVKKWLNELEEKSRERRENLSLDKVAIALRARHFDDWFQWLATCIIKLSEKRIKLGAEERVIRGLIVDLFDDLEDLIDNCIWCGYVYPLGPRTHYKTCEKRKLLFK